MANMTSRERQIYISKVKRFARSKTGLAKIRKIAPEVAQTIELHPEYLEIVQKDNNPLVAGNYITSIFGRPFYSGSSGNAYLRVCEHIYNFLTDATFYGGVYKRGMPAYFTVYATGIESKGMREFIEFQVIQKIKPILQWTDPDSFEYGNDKPIPSSKTRDSMRPDICISVPMRFKRFEQAQAAAEQTYKKKVGCDQ